MQSRTLFSWISAAGGFASGLGYMYYFDPDRGRYRRSLARDRLIHLRKVSMRSLGHRARDFGNRAQGLVARLRSRVAPGQVTDDILVARVASKLGRLITHTHPIELTADDGVIHVGGPILKDEIDALVQGISKVPGVKSLKLHLEVIEGDENDLSRAAARHTGGAA